MSEFSRKILENDVILCHLLKLYQTVVENSNGAVEQAHSVYQRL